MMKGVVTNGSLENGRALKLPNMLPVVEAMVTVVLQLHNTHNTEPSVSPEAVLKGMSSNHRELPSAMVIYWCWT